MNISWNWLLQYVRYDGPSDEAIDRMTMSGLNVDGVEVLPDGDLLLDVEVTSNRPDCLGHLGVARELAAVTGSEFVVPEADIQEGDAPVADLAAVRVDDSVGCPRYTARVIQGVKIAPSPDWLAARLTAVGLRPVNNVVDVTNFVLYEHGQPLHAFDHDLLEEKRIIVRRADRGEAFTAIDHSQHRLQETDLVIADASRAVALAGIMGGVESEVHNGTVNVLLESAQFDPLAIRTTSRREQLMSDSSYRFERGVDWDGVEWASRRACRLIVDVAGGAIARGIVDVAVEPPERHPVRLRFDQVARLLGVDVPRDEIERILKALGLEEVARDADGLTLLPPRFRRDLTREADLVEEVARVFGYDRIPYLDTVPTLVPQESRQERVVAVIQDALVAAGFHETVTVSLTDAASAGMFSPDDASAPLTVGEAGPAGMGSLRKSVLAGLLQVKRANQAGGVPEVALFEQAKGFRDAPDAPLPQETFCVAMLTDEGFEAGKGSVELMAERLGLAGRLVFEPSTRVEELAEDGQADITLDGQVIGFAGTVSDKVAGAMKFRRPPWVAELNVAALVEAAELVPRYRPVPQLPSIERDLALVIDEPVTWREIETAAAGAGVAELEAVDFVSLYRGKQIPENKKCVALRLTFRGQAETLTHEEADRFQKQVLSRLQEATGATLRES